jgi:Family of unknown function (DUF6152)
VRISIKLASFAAGLAFLAVMARPTMAHHAFAAEFDMNKPFEVSGVVAKVAWQNPHVYVYLDAKDEAGKTLTYAMECNSVNTLVHKGWTRDALKKGDKITISAYGAKDPRPLSDGSIHANARSIKFLDGHSVSAGSSAGEDKK